MFLAVHGGLAVALQEALNYCLILAGRINRLNTEDVLEKAGYRVVAVVFFREREVARFATREQAEWRAKELNEWAERNPRGYIHYLVRPAAGTREAE